MIKLKGFKLVIAALLLLGTAGCKAKHKGEQTTGFLSNFVNISEKEDKGIKEILAFYGGKCEYGYETKAEKGKDTEKIFWIKLSNSNELDTLIGTPGFEAIEELSGANIAYLFYKNIGNEKYNYTSIKTILVSKKIGQTEYLYSIAELDKVNRKMPLVNKIVDFIIQKQFAELGKKFTIDKQIIDINIDTMITKLQDAESIFGNASGFVLDGFRFITSNSGKRVLIFSGYILRDKQNNLFSIAVDPDTFNETIYNLDYTL
jgi:hypothetical protein